MSAIQTPAFDAFTRVASILEPKLPTGIEQISSIYESSDVIVTIIGDGSRTTLQVLDTKTMNVLDIDYEGIISQTLTSGSANITNVGFAAAQHNLDDLLKHLSLSKIGSNKLPFNEINSKGIVSGIAGLVANADRKQDILELFATYGFNVEMVYLAGDVDLAKHLIGEDGAILIAGTGSICFSKSHGIEKRIGGLGYALGDEGSYFYIGKLAVKAALKSKFEKSNAFVLSDKLCEILGLGSIDEAIKLFYNGTIKPGDIAKAAPYVFEAAFKQNDSQCKLIVAKAAAELAEHITIATQNSNETAFPVYLIGDSFKTEYSEVFIKMINQNLCCNDNVELINVSEDNLALQVISKHVVANKFAAPALSC
jgi:N-acetylglucosamine kinase-like BadF-type ATPase